MSQRSLTSNLKPQTSNFCGLSPHHLRPKGAQCRRAALRRWTGWPDEVIDNMIASDLLHPRRYTFVLRRKKARPKRNGSKPKEVKSRYWFNVAEVDFLLYG
jgi:hypothetical protein